MNYLINNMKIFHQPKKNKNYIVTIATGKKYYSRWKIFSYPLWIKYCLKHDIGLIVFIDELISKKNPKWKKPIGKNF